RLAEIVLQVFQADGLIVAFDGEDLAEHAFEAERLAFLARDIELQETIVRLDLHVGKDGDFDRVPTLAEIPDLRGNNSTLGGNRHECLPIDDGPRAASGRRAWASLPEPARGEWCAHKE